MGDSSIEQEQALLLAARPADLEARSRLVELYRYHWNELCHYVRTAFGAGPPGPDDVAQSAFIQLAGHPDPASIRNPRGYLYSIARNIVIDQRRREKTHRRYAQEALIERTAALDECDGERTMLERERQEILHAVIARLPQPHRRLLIEHRVHNLSYAEISRRHRLPQTTVKRLIAAAVEDCLDALRKAYGNADHEL